MPEDEDKDEDDLVGAWAALRPGVPKPKVKGPKKAKPRPTPPPVAPTVLPGPTGVTPVRPNPPTFERPAIRPPRRRIEIPVSTLFEYLGFTIIAAFVAGLFWITFNSIRADGKILNCYVEKVTNVDRYEVNGRVDWRPDITMGSFPTMDMAIEGKKRICP